MAEKFHKLTEVFQGYAVNRNAWTWDNVRWPFPFAWVPNQCGWWHCCWLVRAQFSLISASSFHLVIRPPPGFLRLTAPRLLQHTIATAKPVRCIWSKSHVPSRLQTVPLAFRTPPPNAEALTPGSCIAHIRVSGWQFPCTSLYSEDPPAT